MGASEGGAAIIFCANDAGSELVEAETSTAEKGDRFLA